MGRNARPFFAKKWKKILQKKRERVKKSVGFPSRSSREIYGARYSFSAFFPRAQGLRHLNRGAEIRKFVPNPFHILPRSWKMQAIIFSRLILCHNAGGRNKISGRNPITNHARTILNVNTIEVFQKYSSWRWCDLCPLPVWRHPHMRWRYTQRRWHWRHARE